MLYTCQNGTTNSTLLLKSFIREHNILEKPHKAIGSMQGQLERVWSINRRAQSTYDYGIKIHIATWLTNSCCRWSSIVKQRRTCRISIQTRVERRVMAPYLWIDNVSVWNALLSPKSIVHCPIHQGNQTLADLIIDREDAHHYIKTVLNEYNQYWRSSFTFYSIHDYFIKKNRKVVKIAIISNCCCWFFILHYLLILHTQTSLVAPWRRDTS